jgi:hypothetical protein
MVPAFDLLLFLVDDLAQSAKALEQGRADLAVIRRRLRTASLATN